MKSYRHNNKDTMSEEEITVGINKLKKQREKEEYFHQLMSSNFFFFFSNNIYILYFIKNNINNCFCNKIEKQDKLLFVAFYILLNLAEDVTIEKKMIKKELINHLILMLSRKNADLLILTVTFLRKLSIIEENKDTMKTLLIVPKLIKFIPCPSQALITNILRLLFNLSFDKDCRHQMIRAGLLPKLIKLLSTQACFRGRSLKLLYHLSADDTCKSMFSFSGSNVS